VQEIFHDFYMILYLQHVLVGDWRR